MCVDLVIEDAGSNGAPKQNDDGVLHLVHLKSCITLTLWSSTDPSIGKNVTENEAQIRLQGPMHVRLRLVGLLERARVASCRLDAYQTSVIRRFH